MSGTASGFTATVLVVEDEALTRLDAVWMLEAAGFDTVEAGDADEALQVLEARDDIHVVFTDVQMPGSMDGFGLARVVGERWPAVIALVTSGNVDGSEAGMHAGVPFFPKPYTAIQIASEIRERLSRSHGPEADRTA
jgi:CheY-like chemotaxis protein